MSAEIQDRQQDFERLRREHPVFGYDGHAMRRRGRMLDLAYRYQLSTDCSFSSRFQIQLPSESQPSDSELEALEPLFFALGLVDIISYWKCACSPVIELRTGSLSEQQIRWWRHLYHRGLGEFLHRNGIQVEEVDLVRFESTTDRTVPRCPELATSGDLIPVGGGKDSVVTLELLAPRRGESRCFLLNPTEASRRVVGIAGYGEDRVVEVRRWIDQPLLELNEQGYLNGHTPFSALLQMLSLLVAALWKHRYVVFSNEASANEPTVPGTDVNHQYSKSFAFEHRLSRYIEKHLTSDIVVFSLLRPWNELQIARELARHERYHQAFRSCNAGAAEDRWCGSCAKCLFVYLVLSPFLPSGDLVEIFGSDLLGDPDLEDAFASLHDPGRSKPFECVGTREEVRATINYLLELHRQQRQPPPRLLQPYLAERPPPAQATRAFQRLLNTFSLDHLIPEAHGGLLT